MKNRLLVSFLRFLKGRFDLTEDNATQKDVELRVQSGVVFRGTNLWVLIFATFIASIGLNVNSTAVIIGAMLISPLMGPIVGMGLSLAINDFDLIKRATRNYAFMITISILTSTLYFLLTPLTQAQSELLARTQPVVWDVLIALFGGMAGMVASTRTDKTSTVIPGVAIATALMPPLCTAGYGLATAQINYFLGAFYLFIINTVFIAIGSFLVVSFLKYKKKHFIDSKYERKVKRIMATVIIVTIAPSVIIAYNLVRESIFKQNVSMFITKSFNFSDTKVLEYSSEFRPRDSKNNKIEVILFGKPITNEAIEMLQAQMSNFDISNTELIVKQAESNADLGSSFIQTNFEQLLHEKNNKISELTSSLDAYKDQILPSSEISREMSALFNMPVSVALSKAPVYNSKGVSQDTILLCFVHYDVDNVVVDKTVKERIIDWLKVRTGTNNIKLIQDISKNNRLNNSDNKSELEYN